MDGKGSQHVQPRVSERSGMYIMNTVLRATYVYENLRPVRLLSWDSSTALVAQ